MDLWKEVRIMRITIKGNEFYTFIGKNGGVRTNKKPISNVPNKYCTSCYTYYPFNEQHECEKEVK